MNLRTLSLGIIISLFSITALAGGGHNHGHGHSHSPANQETAIANATKVVAALVSKNKLDKSWTSITASSADKKEFKGEKEWVIVFVNDKITDSAKKKLYVFLTLGGDYIAANHSGN